MSLSSHEELLMLRKRARRRLVGAVVMVFVATVVLWNILGALPEQEMRPEKVEISGFPASSPAAAPMVASAPEASQPVETDILAELPPEGGELDAPLTQMASAVVAPAAAPVRTVPPVAVPVVPPVKSAEMIVPKKPEPAPLKPPVEKKTVAEKPVTERPSIVPPVTEKKPAARDPAAILEGRDVNENPPPVKAETKTEAKGEKFQIQLAALSDPAKVDALKQRLASVGVSARFSKVQTSKGEVTRVRVGPFGSRAEADSALRRLDKAGVSGIVVTQ